MANQTAGNSNSNSNHSPKETSLERRLAPLLDEVGKVQFKEIQEARRSLASTLTLGIVLICGGVTIALMKLLWTGTQPEKILPVLTQVLQTLGPLVAVAIGWMFATRQPPTQ